MTGKSFKIRVSGVLIGLAALAAFPALAGENGASADELFAAQRWEKAAAAYGALVAEDPSNAEYWFRLGRARHQLKDFDGARDAYLKAIENGFQPLPRARYHLARALMSLGETEKALTQLEEIAKTGGPSSAVIQNTPEFAPLSDNPRYIAVLEALKPCKEEEYRQFDFWLGEWDVTPAGASKPRAHNSISSAQDGCVVFEQYTAGGFTGMSINFYDSVTGKWHQTWMANDGAAVYLEGGLSDTGAMVMTDKDLPVSTVTGTVNRVTWTPLKDGRVRQHWESSADRSKTWTTVFDGYYSHSVQN